MSSNRNIVYNMFGMFCMIYDKAVINSQISDTRLQEEERRKWWQDINNYNNRLKRMSLEDESGLYNLINFEIKKKIFNITDEDIRDYLEQNNIPLLDYDPIDKYWKAEEILFNIKSLTRHD